MTRRAILASLGIGMAMPALKASGQSAKKPTPGPVPDPDKAFEDYWVQVSGLIEARDKEKDAKKKEILDLKIEFLRRDVMVKVNRSGFSPCPQATPTPTAR